MKRLRKGVLLPMLVLISSISWAQNKTITGKITDELSEPIAGATVIVKGSKTGTTTNETGVFTLSVPASAKILIVSSVGFGSKEVTITGDIINVTLEKMANANLEEVVVVGYGTQKKKVVTGSISSVKAKDLENVPNGRIEQSLQGRVSGVTILQNSGQPGSNSTIRVRGVTTFGDGGNNPLWVVDGVVVDAGGIGYLNQSDIESIEVLKDAASAAIYGTRAATGVILVTTKKGKAGKMTVAYNGFYGQSAPAKVLNLLNATQYATLLNERSVAGGGDIMFTDVASLGKGTDWQKAIFNNKAPRSSNEISLSGGNDRSTYFVSAGILNQDGIVATDISKYSRKNIRLNSTHKISSVFTFGQTLGYSHQKGIGLGNTNSEFGGPLSSAINLDPITPLVVTDPTAASAPPYNSNPVIRDANGNPYGISSIVGQEMTNPLAYIQTRMGNYSWSDDIVGNAYLEAAITKDLKVRSTMGAKLAYWGGVGFTPLFYLSATNSTNQNSYGKSENKVFNWNIENTITYTKHLGEHNFTVLLGQGSYVESIGGGSSLTLFNLPISSYKDASFSFDIPQANRNSGSYDAIQHKLTSLFGRVNYGYKDKYLFTGILRRDGSSRFGLNNKFGIFPSFSAGWVIDKEDFWQANDIISSLKIRGGYGVVGNDAIGDFGYLSTVVGGYNYSVGNSGAITTGYAPRTLDNPNLRWEQTSQANIGVEAQLFNTLSLTVDVYKKKTTGILRPITIPGYVGVSNLPSGNVADMENSGIEVELGYRKKFGDFNFSAFGNVAYLKNEVTYVAADADFISGEAGFQSMGNVTRIQVGQSYNAFYGYKTAGIFQNDAQINDYKNSSGIPIQPDARPGDFRWVDMNNDGQINEDDKTFLGSNIPKYTFGLTVNLDYKGFDFMAFAQGAAGNKIFQGLRRLDIGNGNYPTIAMSRWTGEGTSDKYPRLVSNDPNGNFGKMSDFYLEKGDYLRLKIVQIGYSLPNNPFFTKIGLSRLRVYITAENLLTLTNYTGYDPEVGGGVFGIDKGQYPQARSFIGGIQVQF
ncbi:SusC/RagA family TonB-linked outer membrane protein [Terrimonas sp.]|uniref:SusC/RagA family TonB-linked outer membrane protein n=1 Tax=Terrimonas sp. TaxID=1914338 RepID=UPI000D5225CB|nr:TonB-dependent receptor [Terrimonas sp.]PVD50121.1 SusC/RagA family TonB-linked outer membrane protein [Terrimonas sp.]